MNKGFIFRLTPTAKVFAAMTAVLLVCCLGIISCNDKEEEPTPLQTGTVTDVDGIVYQTVWIGGKWWMAENLRVRHYRNGEDILHLPEDSLWDSDAPGYSVHPDATTDMGYLYNWAAVSNGFGLAPDGWHIPSDQEWKDLELALGMESSEVIKSGWRGSTEGDALKAEGTGNWARFDPVWASNSSGFTALSGSCRLFNGTYGSPGRFYTGFWWTSSESISDPDQAWYRYLDYKSSAIFRQNVQKRYGMSVRCVKD